MVVISRGLARSFRALARRCVSGRPRGPAPAVVCEVRAGTLTAWTRTDHAGLVYTAPSRCDDEVVVIPMAVLEAVEGGGGDPVELAVGAKLVVKDREVRSSNDLGKHPAILYQRIRHGVDRDQGVSLDL